jgi:hypothetical protein
VGNATGRTGQVFLEDFDVGFAETLGGELIEILLDGELAPEYAIRIEGVTGPDQYSGMVPISFSNPEDVFQENLLPHLYINRSSFTPDMMRWFGGGREYMVPAADGETVAVMNPDGTVTQAPKRVERKAWTYPYNLTYEIHIRARLRTQADSMLKLLGKHLWAYGQVFLTDSIGEERGYYAFAESIDGLDEIADISDRTLGHTFSVRVEGELDFFEPVILPTQTNLNLNVGAA